MFLVVQKKRSTPRLHSVKFSSKSDGSMPPVLVLVTSARTSASASTSTSTTTSTSTKYEY